MVQQQRPREGSAEKMEVQRRENQPPADRVNPGIAAEAPGKKREEQRAEQNPHLRAEEFEMNQGSPGHWRGKKKCHLGFGERERGAFVRNQPREHHDHKQHQRAERFGQRQIFRRNGHHRR